jgi:hypothetical protein
MKEYAYNIFFHFAAKQRLELYLGIIANKKNIGDYYIGVYDWYRKMDCIATMKIPIIAIIDGLSGNTIFFQRKIIM